MLNHSENYEHLCNVKLTKEKYPIAYKNKLRELVNSGMTEKEAEDYLKDSEIELELYYHEEYGMFAVESDAVDNGAEIYSPYTGEKYSLPMRKDEWVSIQMKIILSGIQHYCSIFPSLDEVVIFCVKDEEIGEYYFATENNKDNAILNYDTICSPFLKVSDYITKTNKPYTKKIKKLVEDFYDDIFF